MLAIYTEWNGGLSRKSMLKLESKVYKGYFYRIFGTNRSKESKEKSFHVIYKQLSCDVKLNKI